MTKGEIRKHLREVKTYARMLERELTDAGPERLERELTDAGPERLELLANELVGIADQAGNEVIDYCMEKM